MYELIIIESDCMMIFPHNKYHTSLFTSPLNSRATTSDFGSEKLSFMLLHIGFGQHESGEYEFFGSQLPSMQKYALSSQNPWKQHGVCSGQFDLPSP
ncbi:hypothetical protein AYI69_g2302 [Smittium culicis]|uniref:Uncharacterized protein n=1 Tax=Smittium culicis TaxID=133412 RepID=A0A1R1YMX0_9FUNG|nr:hypothetical protein AYI69_g2302 [Smittium culicis]